VKHIVRAHHGKIMLDSQPGSGSKFRIVLPAWFVARDLPTARNPM